MWGALSPSGGPTHPVLGEAMSLGGWPVGPVQMAPGSAFLPEAGSHLRLLPKSRAMLSSTVAMGPWHVASHTQMCCESRRHARSL